jgi:signal transduction histidine kinase
VFKNTKLIFSLLVTYIVLQFLWWETLLVKQSNEIISQQQHIIALSTSDYNEASIKIEALEKKKNLRVYMIVGEGTVFLLILLYGIHLVRKSIRKETQLNNQQKNFILSVSHELKTPLAATKLQLQTMLKHDLSRDKQETLLNNALTENNRLHKLIENVLIANQIEGNTISINRTELNFSEYLSNLIYQYFSEQIKNKTIELDIEPNIHFSLDKDLFPSVIINLVENAIKYSTENIKVLIQLKKANGTIVLEVRDNGIGINETERDKVFEKFYRSGDEETRKTKGTGIGLYLVKSICELHHAKILVMSNVPKGSIFQILFK